MKDIIYVENRHFVSVRNESLKFKHMIDGTIKYFLLEDIDGTIFDHPQSYFSQKLVVKYMENNIAVIFCDRKHSPITELLSTFRTKNRLQRIHTHISINI